MGLFKKKAVIVKTFTQVFNKEVEEENEKIERYQKLIPRLQKFVEEYKQYFDNFAHIYGESIQLQFKKDYEDYPDGFFALADKLGLNIEPCCTRYGLTYTGEESHKSFNVRAKSK